MRIKHFDLPTFEEWGKMDYHYESRLGEFDIEIEESSWCTDGTVTYGFAVASNQIPMNVYARAIYRHIFTCHRSEKDKLKDWYETEVIKFREFWENYIYDTYFEEVVKCNNCNCPYGYWGNGDCLAPSEIYNKCGVMDNNGEMT